jgi:hypothetical protein
MLRQFSLQVEHALARWNPINDATLSAPHEESQVREVTMGQRSEERQRPESTRSPTRVAQDRMLSSRTYRYLGRPPRLQGLPMPRPPYFAAAVTAAVFIFLAYLILGGA